VANTRCSVGVGRNGVLRGREVGEAAGGDAASAVYCDEDGEEALGAAILEDRDRVSMAKKRESMLSGCDFLNNS
jgi:hypothetical protein